MMFEQQAALETIYEKELKNASDSEAPSTRCADSDGSPGPSSSCTSDDETAPIQLAQVQQVPTPKLARNKPPLAEQLTSKLTAMSAGRPVKVWLPPDVEEKIRKRLDANIPAKKKPKFAEYASGKKKSLDPSLPCKKHMPSWLVNLDAVPSASKTNHQTFVPAPPAPVATALTAEPAPR